MAKKREKALKTKPDHSSDQNETGAFRIDANGCWFHEGGEIKRHALAKLFADRGLKVDEEGRYWLQSPFEKYRVEVEDVPFLIIDFEETPRGLTLKTNMDETIDLGAAHPIILKHNERQGMRLPYVEVRSGLYARLNRSVYYALVERFGQSFESGGAIHVLGELDG